MNDLRRHFLLLFLPVALLVLTGALFYGNAEIERELTRLHASETLNVGRGATVLSRQLDDLARDLVFLSVFSDLRDALDAPTPQNIHHLELGFANFSRSKGIYDQIRWIDETGMERVRVDYLQGMATIVPTSKLQNKGQRYFFTDSFKLNPGEMFVSPLDLNIEQNQIEIPHKPMVRLATPVTDSRGRKRGIIILNYFGRLMLDDWKKATADIADHAMVVNSDGYWLKAPRAEDEWGFMFKKPELSLAARSPVAWQAIRTTDSGQVQMADGLWTWQTVYPLLAGQKSSTGAAEAFVPSRGEVETKQYVWKTVAHLPAAAMTAVSAGVWGKLATAVALLLTILAMGSWKLARAWVAQAGAEAEVRRINAGLERLVAERTEELEARLAELDESHALLEAKNEEMESMIYIASHDLRSPLVNIQGFGQRLEKAVGDVAARLQQDDVPEPVRKDLAKLLGERIPSSLGYIHASSEKMDGLIDGLLRLSRTGRAQLSPQPLDMSAMLHDILGTLATQIRQAGAQIDVDALPPCMGDPTQVNQIFTNLIDNALKYRDPARPLAIHIGGECHGTHVRYWVADTGRGIPAEAQAKVWQLFQRLDPAGPVGGEGIGLTLVRRMVERQHGRIALHSAAGEGSRFMVELPVPPVPQNGFPSVTPTFPGEATA